MIHTNSISREISQIGLFFFDSCGFFKYYLNVKKRILWELPNSSELNRYREFIWKEPIEDLSWIKYQITSISNRSKEYSLRCQNKYNSYQISLYQSGEYQWVAILDKYSRPKRKFTIWPCTCTPDTYLKSYCCEVMRASLPLDP